MGEVRDKTIRLLYAIIPLKGSNICFRYSVRFVLRRFIVREVQARCHSNDISRQYVLWWFNRLATDFLFKF